MPGIKNRILDAVVLRINENIVRGRASRISLGVKLAEMPPREIAKLPRSVLMRIGPEGFATMARVAAGTDDILPTRHPDIPMQRPEKSKRALLPLWQLCSGLALVVIVLTILAGALERPCRWALARIGLVMPENAGLCARLDRWTDQCTYVVTGSAINIANVADRLVFDVYALSLVNPHLPIGIPLPAGTIIRIDRNSWR